MKRPQLVSRGTVQRLLLAAGESWKKRDYQQAIETLERANRLDPASPAILLNLGRYHGLRFDFAAAEQCLEKAVRVAPNKTETLALAGEQCRDFSNLELAERYFQRAASQPDASAEILVRQAEFYERARRNDEAHNLVTRALELNSASGPALLARARLERLAGRLDAAEPAARALLALPDPGAQPGPARDTRIRGWYELGAILDRQKRFDDAFTAFNQAKSMLRLHAAPERAGLRAIRDRLRQLRQEITPDHLQRWSVTGPQLQPARRLALLGGHPRSGTTLLEQVLDSHPDIVSAEETTIFHDDIYLRLTPGSPDTAMLSVLEAAAPDALRQLRADYFRLMESTLGREIGARLLIDKNPSYTFLVPALVRVFPEIKLLIALRDPRDVVLSCFMQAFIPLGQTTSAYLSLEGAVDEYVELMTMWTTTKPMLRNPWIEVRYEDMVENLEAVSRRVLEFLEAPWDEKVLRFDEHARQKMVRSPTYAEVTKPVFKTAVGRWRNYQKQFEPHLAKLEPFVKAFGYA